MSVCELHPPPPPPQAPLIEYIIDPFLFLFPEKEETLD